MNSFATGIYYKKGDLHECVYAKCRAKNLTGGTDVVVFSNALHMVDWMVMEEKEFLSVYEKAHRIAIEELG